MGAVITYLASPRAWGHLQLGAWRLMFNLDEHWAEWNHVHQPEAV